MRGKKGNCHQYVSTSSVKSSLCELRFSTSHQSDYPLLDILLSHLTVIGCPSYRFVEQ